MLNEHGIYLNVSAQAIGLSGQNVGSAVIVAWEDGVVSNEKGLSTSAYSGGAGSQDVANDMMVTAIRDAVKRLDFAKAIQELETWTAKLRGIQRVRSHKHT